MAAGSQLCNICYSDEHEPGTIGVACDAGHFICSDCFAAYVTSESDTVNNPAKIIERGGRILCVQQVRSRFDLARERPMSWGLQSAR